MYDHKKLLETFLVRPVKPYHPLDMIEKILKTMFLKRTTCHLDLISCTFLSHIFFVIVKQLGVVCWTVPFQNSQNFSLYDYKLS